jgi:hypothetical protein
LLQNILGGGYFKHFAATDSGLLTKMMNQKELDEQRFQSWLERLEKSLQVSLNAFN